MAFSTPNEEGIINQSGGPAPAGQRGSKSGSERTPLLANQSRRSASTNHEASLVLNNSNVDMGTGVSWGVAAFLLVNTALGAGMLNYPYAYNQIGGILAAALIQIVSIFRQSFNTYHYPRQLANNQSSLPSNSTTQVLLIFISATMFILVYCADINHDNSYHDVLLSMCGKRAQQLSAFSIFLTCYGINVTFLVIIGDQYDRIFNSLLSVDLLQDNSYWYLDRKFTIFITALLFIWPMCYAKRLDFLRHASILGLFAMLYVAFLTVYEHYKLDSATIAAIISKSSDGTGSGPAQTMAIGNQTNPVNSSSSNQESLSWSLATKTIKWFEPLAIVPVLCFAYQTHEVIVPVYACMKARCIGQFMRASLFGLIILFFLYNLVGAYGYLTFGEQVGADIMSLYDAKDPVVVVGIVALVIKFITTYPPLMFCGRGALDGLYGELTRMSSDQFKRGERIRRIVISTLWFFSTVLLAVFAPDISITLQLLGSMASINVFVFPGMCLVSLTRRLRKARKALLSQQQDDIHDSNFCQQNGSTQRAEDYFLISGSCFGAALKRQQKSMRAAENYYKYRQSGNSNHNNLIDCNDSLNNYSNGLMNNDRQQFTATFASLIEFENNFNSYSKNNSKRTTNEEQANNTNNNNSCISYITTPSTIAQIGISRCTALGLYIFSAFIILFGIFIFMLELVTVVGLI